MLYSTSDLRPHERFDYWHDVVYRTYAPCTAHVGSRDKFQAFLNVSDFGAVEITDVRSNAVQYERRQHDVRIGPRDDLFVSLMLRGETLFAQSDRQMLQGPGDVLIYDAGRPYVYKYDGEYQSLLMRIPRPILESRQLNADDLGGRVLHASSPFGRLIGSLVSESHQIALNQDTFAIGDFVPSMLDMLATAVRQSFGADGIGYGNRLILTRVKQHMRKNLADTELTLERISRDQSISMRTLSRIFAETGVTPIGWLQSERLKSAYAALAEKKVRSVTEAAFEFGFKDVSHFGRSFKKTYGVTPKSIFGGP